MASQTSARQAARVMFRHAIADSSTQLGLKESKQVIEALRKGDCYHCDTVRYNLARRIAEYLTTLDADMRAIYMYNPEYVSGDYESPRTPASPSSAINLIAWTRTKHSVPADVIEALGVAFQDARADILCEKASGLCFSLNVAVVNDAEVRTRKGYAALIDSVSVRPTEVWAKYRVANNRTE